MTNEEAIKGLKKLRSFHNGSYGEHIDMAIKALEQRWIPVSERLPEDKELILFSTKTDRVYEGRYFEDNTDRQWYSFRDDTFAWNNIVTAWMPLPEPYVPVTNVGKIAESEDAE